MTTQEITSFSNPEVIYDLTLDKDGWAIDCSCPNHYFAKKRILELGLNQRHFCKHLTFYNQQKGLTDAAAEREREENRGCYLRMMESPY